MLGVIAGSSKLDGCCKRLDVIEGSVKLDGCCKRLYVIEGSVKLDECCKRLDIIEGSVKLDGCYWAIQAGLLTPLTFARHRLSPLAAFTFGAYFLHNGRR